MKHPLKRMEYTSLKGSIKTGAEGTTMYPLRSIADDVAYLRRIHLESTTDLDNVLIEDIKVGRNSQTACAGTFKASIINRLPALRFDPVSPRMDVTLVLGGIVEGTCEVFLQHKKDDGCRHTLFPAGRTQVIGNVSEFVVTDKLFAAIESNEVRVEAVVSPDVHEHQAEFVVNQLIGLELSNGRIHLTSGQIVRFAPGDNLQYHFEGPRAAEFTSNDIVALLEVIT